MDRFIQESDEICGILGRAGDCICFSEVMLLKTSPKREDNFGLRPEKSHIAVEKQLMQKLNNKTEKFFSFLIVSNIILVINILVAYYMFSFLLLYTHY
jgi:hypothetical protein